MLVDTTRGEFCVPTSKLSGIKSMAKDVLCHAARNKRYVDGKSWKSFVALGASLYLVLPKARRYLRSVYDVFRTDTGVPHLKLPHQAVRDLNWWLALSSEWNGKAIW